MKVWRLRHKDTGEYFEGGRKQTLFTRPTFARRSWEDLHRTMNWRDRTPVAKFSDQTIYELVEFDLVEVVK